MIHALILLAAIAPTDYPKDGSPAACESAAQAAFDVCNAMTAAAKAEDFDTLLGHCTARTRSHFGEAEKLAVEGLHSLLVGVRCVRVSKQDDAATPPMTLVWVYAPDGKSRNMPFVKEHDLWRFDVDVYEKMHGKKR